MDGVLRDVPVVTIDGVCAEKGLAGPYLIKVDIPGGGIAGAGGGSADAEGDGSGDPRGNIV